MKKICTVLFVCMLHATVFSQNTFRNKAMMLRRFFEQQHYQPLVWNDSAAVLLYNKWMEELDEEKLFFTQQDIAVLEKFKTKLDDEMLGKGWDFFNVSVSLYKKQLQKTDSIIKLLTAKPFDFSKPDNITWPFTGFAANDAALVQRWQQYLKWRTLFSIAEKNNNDIKQPVDFVQKETEARTKLQRKEQAYVKSLLDADGDFNRSMEDAYLNSIAWCYDPHSEYMNLEEKNAFETEMSAAEYSAGLDLEENEKGDKTVSYLQPGGSAWRSGQLHKGDVIVRVKADGKEEDAADISEGELGSYLNGASEKDVELTVRTPAGETKTVLLHKEKISDDEGIVKSYVLHGKQNIGYISLPGFYSREDANIKDENDIKYDGCANDVSKEIVKLKKDTIAGLILDLRYNGGGSMWEAMQLAGIFIDIGPVASEKEKDGKVMFLKDPNRGTIYDGPMIVLINGGSASASEFLSAALQDYNRALVVGGVSYGKGTAQQVLPLDTIKIDKAGNYKDFVKITLSKFYRVNGSTTQWKGVVPDIQFPDLYADEAYKERHNASALQPDESKKGFYQQLPALPVAALAAKSKQRVAGSEYFKNISNFAQWMQQYKKGRVIPLQWPSYITAYTDAKKMRSVLADEDDKKKPVLLRVTNNGFDWQQVLQSTQRSREINSIYISHIETDPEIAEGFHILSDWTEK